MKFPKTLTAYVSRAFLLTLTITLIVLSFIMSLGILFKITDLLAHGAPLSGVFHIFWTGIPAAMMFAIPMSTLVASLLLFGRLSSDGEITAMRVSGLSMEQIMRGPLMLAGVATLFCFYLNGWLAPWSHNEQWQSIRQLATQSPLEMLDVGRYQEFPNMNVYIESKDGNVLHGVRIATQTQNGTRREILAERGVIVTSEKGGDIELNLDNVTIDPMVEDQPGKGSLDKYRTTLQNAMKDTARKKKPTDFSLVELVKLYETVEQNYPHLSGASLDVQRTVFRLEIHKRFVLTLSCFSFAFLGIPLGIRSHRKESSIGVAISLVLVLNFYLFIMVAESLVKIPGSHPEIVMWLPVVISLIAGRLLTRRAN